MKHLLRQFQQSGQTSLRSFGSSLKHLYKLENGNLKISMGKNMLIISFYSCSLTQRDSNIQLKETIILKHKKKMKNNLLS